VQSVSRLGGGCGVGVDTSLVFLYGRCFSFDGRYVSGVDNFIT